MSTSRSRAANLLQHPDDVGAHPWSLFYSSRRTGYPFLDDRGTAALLVEAGSESQHDARQEFSAGAQRIFVFTVICKAQTRHWVNLVLWAPELHDSGAFAWFDLAAGAIGTAQIFGPSGDASALGVSMEAWGDGWYRCRLACRLDASRDGMRHIAQIQLGQEDAAPSYPGDGMSGLLVGPASLTTREDTHRALGAAGDLFVNSAFPTQYHWPPPPPRLAGSVQGEAEARLESRRLTLAPAVRVLSPAFPVVYPHLVNPELISDGSRHAMEMSWSRENFPARQVDFFRLPRAFISNEGLVFDEDLRVIEQSTQYHAADLIDRCRADIATRLATGHINRQVGPSVVVKRPASGNYYHYLAEMFPRASIAHALLGDYRLRDRKPFYIVNRTAVGLLDAMYQSLRQIGVGLDQLLVLDNDPVQCEELFFVHGVTDHGSFMSPLVVGALAALARTVPPAPRHKLFIARKSGGRMLCNEAALTARMVAAGYTVVDPGAISLQDQVATFRGAAVVVGVLGAAMTNIAFCDPGTPVAVITAGCYPDTCFWFIAQHRGLPYLEVRCDQVENPPVIGGNWDFVIRDEDIEMLTKF